MNVLEKLAQQGEAQDSANAVDPVSAFIRLRHYADKLAGEYVQYEGKVEGWGLGRIKRTVHYKGGDLREGDYVLVSPTVEDYGGGYRARSAFSIRKQGYSAVSVGDVEVLLPQKAAV